MARLHYGVLGRGFNSRTGFTSFTVKSYVCNYTRPPSSNQFDRAANLSNWTPMPFKSPTLSINVNDATTITEATNSFYQLYLNKEDAVLLSDVSDQVIKTFNTSLVDSVSVSDHVSALVKIFKLTINDITLNLVPVISKSDEITIDDDPFCQLSYITTLINDEIEVSESVTAHIRNLTADVFNELFLSDDVSVIAGAPSFLTINVSDSAAIADNTTAKIPYLLAYATDGASIDDTAFLIQKQLIVNINDVISVGELTASIIGGIRAEVHDSVSLSDSIESSLGNLIAIASDTIAVVDARNAVLAGLNLAISDAIGIQDYSDQLIKNLNAIVNDATTVLESIGAVRSVLELAVSDDVLISEYIELFNTGLYRVEELNFVSRLCRNIDAISQLQRNEILLLSRLCREIEGTSPLCRSVSGKSPICQDIDGVSILKTEEY